MHRPATLDEESKSNEVSYEALVLATGTALTPPGNVPGESKAESVEWFKAHQEEVKNAKRIAIIGGGAVGVRKSSDVVCFDYGG